MKLIFVYAGQPNDGRRSAPYSITTNVYNYLSQKINIEYHQWDACYDVDVKEDDIVLGHPHYDHNTIIQRIFRTNKKCKAKYLIHPFHHNRVEDNFPFNDLAMEATGIFSICGPYWYDTIDGTVFAHWKPKITRLDLAVDESWKYLKSTFNPIGCRGIVYVGSAMPQKNLGLLYEIARTMKNTRFDWYGGSSDHPLAKLPNVYVEGWQDLHHQKVIDICYRNDLFVNTSISDANPTTLLEFGLASGIIPICTQTSGYWKDDCFINIPHNVDEAVSIINDWLNKPTDELVKKSLKNRIICEKEYTWEKFCSTIWNTIKNHL